MLWRELGPDFFSADKVQPILDEWAALALAIPLDGRAPVHFEPGAVRTLLSEHPHFLVLLDNVWSLEAIRPLRDALPAQAHLLVTTRSGTVARGLGGARYELQELTPEEARELIALRLGIQDIAPEVEWCDALAVGLGFHTLALDVALGRILYEGETPSEWRASAVRIVEHVRSGECFEDLYLEGEERDQNVERVLSYSYQRMKETAQRNFRLLGAFAPDSEFDTGSVSRLWECEPGSAKRQLDDFANAALLRRMEGGRWAQHGVLRGYALALLRRAGEYNAAAALHARIYVEAMTQAANAQLFASMRPELPQLYHVFEWALKNDLIQAVMLIGYGANLLTAFGLVRECLGWCESVLVIAQKRSDLIEVYAQAQGCLGNVLQAVARLPGEDRAERLAQALEAYDELLRFLTPDTVPLDYVRAQNNRAILLREFASLPGEDRAQRLVQALAASDESLRFLTPNTAPLDYATTRYNRAVLLLSLASLPGENRLARLAEALRVAWSAFTLFNGFQHEQDQERAASLLRHLRRSCGDAFEALWQQMHTTSPPSWLTEEGAVQAMMREYLAIIASAPDARALAEFWQQVPLKLEAPLVAEVEALISHAEAAGNAAVAEVFRERLEVLRVLQVATTAVNSGSTNE